MLKKQFSKSKPTCKVTFTLPKEAVSKGKSVQLVGEWNDWNEKKAVKMKASKGNYTATVDLKTGRNYEFRYLIGKSKWENDWQADGYVPNPFGFDNSVVSIVSVPSVNKAGKKTSSNGATTKKVAAKKATAKKTTAKKATAKKATAKKATAKKTTAKKATAKKTTAKKTTAKKATAKKTTAKKAPARKTTAKKATARKTTAKKAAPKRATAKKSTAKVTRKITRRPATTATKKVTRSTGKDDLKKVEGIGPKIAEHLNKGGIRTFADLGKAKQTRLKEILNAAGPRYKMHNPGSWPKQAKLAAKGKWNELKALQDKLNGGR